MKIFLTGATGFIGSFLAEALVRSGHEVRCLVRTTSSLRWIVDLDVELYYGSLDNTESLKRGLEGIDSVFHIAGLTKSRTEGAYYRANFGGTKNLLDTLAAMPHHLKRFVLVSSLAAVGPSTTLQPLNESSQARPLTYYGKSKWAAEKYIKRMGQSIPYTIIRPPVVYGPRDTDVLEFFRTVKKGLIPQLDGKSRYISMIYVEDLVRGLLQAAESERAENQIYFLSDPRPYSWEEVARVTLEVVGKRGFRINVPSALMQGLARVSEVYARISDTAPLINRQKVIEMQQDFWVCSPQKAQKELGFESKISLKEGIGRTLAWYTKHGWI